VRRLKWPWKREEPEPRPSIEHSKERAKSLREDTVQTRTHRLSKMPPEELDGVFQALLAGVDKQVEDAKAITATAKESKREARKITSRTNAGFQLTAEQQATIEAKVAEVTEAKKG
jgi:hypothetical protein